MKRLVKKILNHIKCFFLTLEWLVNQLRFENLKKYYKKEYKPHKLIILANGPSLSQYINAISKKIYDSDFLVVNDFCKHKLFFELKPKNYTLADPLYFVTEWMSSSENETLNILSKVDWEMNIFIPYRLMHQYKFNIDNNYLTIIPYHTLPYMGWGKVKLFLFKKGLTMPIAQNVLIPSIFSAIQLGYKIIELYGVDHSWIEEIKVNDTNEVCICDKHFYDDKKAKLIPWKKCEGGVYKMHEILRDLAMMFDGYQQLREFADINNCIIINKTPNSYIDAFERE